MPEGALYLRVGADRDQAKVRKLENGSTENLVSLLDCFPVFYRDLSFVPRDSSQ